MTDFTFEPLTKETFEQNDVVLWNKCAEASLGIEFAGWLWNQMCDGKIVAWKWKSLRGKGLVLVEVRTEPKEKSLHVLAIAGKDYLRHLPQMFEELKVFGRAFDCTKLTGDVRRPGLMKAYEAMGGAEDFRRYEIDLRHS